MKRTVIKRDSTEEPFQTQQIINAIFEIIEGLEVEDDYELVFLIMKELDLKVPERVTTKELDSLVLKAIEQLIPKHPVYDTLATRQLLKLLNKDINRRLDSFEAYLEHAFDENLLDSGLKELDTELLAQTLDFERDGLLNYFGLTTLKDRYLMKDRGQQ